MLQFRNAHGARKTDLLVVFNDDGSVSFVPDDDYYTVDLQPSDVKVLAANLARHVAEHESKCSSSSP
jgi:hypothetical protein